MRGSSLVETILAVFILVIAVAFSALTFHRSLRYQTIVQRKALGVAFCELTLDQVREWAKTPANYAGSWAAWNSFQHGAYADFEARIAVSDFSLMAPSSPLALAVPVAERQVMNASMKRLDLRIFYRGQPEFNLQAFVAEPERLAASVVVTPKTGVPDPLPRDQAVEFVASAKDAGGQTIPDVFFRWTSQPISGNGEVTSTGTGQSAALVNAFVSPDGVVRHTGGQVKVRAVCTVRGRELSGESAAVNLQP